MKKSVDILGLPVISISEGKEMGTVKALVVNPDQGTVANVIVDDGQWYFGAKLLPFTAITGLGEYAVTVESSSSVVMANEAPDKDKRLLTAEVGIIGSKVLTNTGRLAGKVTEYTIDETGKIIDCEVEQADGEVVQVSAQRVLTFGKDVMIIADGDKPVAARPVESTTVAAPAAPKPTPAAPAAEEAHSGDEAAKKFDDKQRKYLLGKKATRRIETDNRVVIVDAGGEITEEVIQKAKLAGKFVELSMSI